MKNNNRTKFKFDQEHVKEEEQPCHEKAIVFLIACGIKIYSYVQENYNYYFGK